MRKKTSLIWILEKEKFIELFNRSNSIKEMLEFFNFRNPISNYSTIVKRLKEEGLDTLKFRKTSNKNRKSINPEKIFTSNSKVSRRCVKKYIIKNNLIDYKCSICKLSNTWENKQLVLVLDHINGICDDNRISNLRFLCPNCNSQTDTFSGRNVKRSIKYKTCQNCFKNKCSIKSSKCYTCSLKTRIKKHKIVWPAKEELEKIVWEKPTSLISKDLGVSDKAIDKWCKKYGISKPPRGYWAKKKKLDLTVTTRSGIMK